MKPNTQDDENVVLSTKFKKLKTFPESLEPQKDVIPEWVFEQAIDWKIVHDKVTGSLRTCFCVPVSLLLRKTSKDTGQEFVTSQIRPEDKTKGEVAEIADQIFRMGQETPIASKYYKHIEETHIKLGNGRWRGTNKNVLSGVKQIPNIISNEELETIPSNYIWTYFLEMTNDMEIYDYQVAHDSRNTAQTNISKKQMKTIIRRKIITGNLTDSQGRWSSLKKSEKVQVICNYLDNVIRGVYTGSGKNLANDILKGQKNEALGIVTWDKETIYEAFKNHISDFSSIFEEESLQKAIDLALKKEASLGPGTVLENVKLLNTGEEVRIAIYCNASNLKEGAAIQHCLLSKIVNELCDKILFFLSFDSGGKQGSIKERQKKAIADIKLMNKKLGKNVIDYCAFPQQHSANAASTNVFFETIESFECATLEE